MSSSERKAFYDSLPRKRSAVGVLIFKGDLLLVLEPTYKPNWLVPGGVVEKSESPLEAAIRECEEEIGVSVQIKSFLCADYKRGNDEIGDAVHFLFEGVVDEKEALRIDGKEIKSFHWMTSQEAMRKFDSHLATRVACGLEARKLNRPVYCEEGEFLF